MNWWGDNPWAVWLGLAAALGVAEMFSLDLVLIMLAVGALAGALTGVFTDSVVAQLLVAVAASVAMLGVVRPSLAKRLHGGPELRLGTTKLIGMQAIAPEPLSTHVPGRIKIDGEMWTAKPYDDSLTIPAGTVVEVFEIRGATAYVHPVHSIEG